ncbi:alpha-mannosidase [Sedimentisphaera salicampi]|uniref:Mannosylglycerate hydrolase n=1 Tax=Sedimentisphaera salicampi TaxID=1941349 RepID=A0A1W6LLN2_9BACT|nr:glycoside hydrolase family 38 C-terminal domain-containing protein [Sedimentisphaera salicampi]ARN56681.1 Mannosylglycerate hydrolase [Sedimentisphaera salicampi]
MFNFFEERDHKILSFKDTIQSKIFEPISDLEVEAYTSKEPLSYPERTTGDRVALQPGEKWGDLFDCAWFHFTGSVPSEGCAKKIVLLIDVNGEACVFDDEGNPVRGLTNGSSIYERIHGEPAKKVLQFNDCGKEGQKVDIWVDAGCNDLIGELSKDGTLEQAQIAVCHENIRSLYYDYWILCELSCVLDKNSARYSRIMKVLFDSMNILQTFNDEEIDKARQILAVEVNRKNADPCLTLSAAGNAHIDLAWLWPIRETIRKAARTFSTVLELMDRYPDYVFGSSQPQLYLWVKEAYPKLYDRIKAKVAEKRWELHGGMWVESDVNMPNGESLIRQFLYGKRFWQSEFGMDTEMLWLPDTFGYSAALPQIMKICGVRYFMTQKLAWNSVNKFPHYTFDWEGIDGSTVLTHILPEETYISHAGPRAISKVEDNYAQKNVSDRALLLYGIGDGGGGPGAEHLERLERLKNLQGVPPVKQEFSEEFFKKIDRDDLDYPRWRGELYLEKHQGTYTSQAKNKKYNRFLEVKLRDLELLASIASLYGFEYPQQKIDEIWKEVLLYQFHDVLPGSSIKRVHDESLQRYEIMIDEVEGLTQGLLQDISGNIGASGTENPVMVFNSLSWERDEWVKLGQDWANVNASAMGWKIEEFGKKIPEFAEFKATQLLLENDALKVEFSQDGSIKSVWDKFNEFEAIRKGEKANVLKLYTDNGDAWDIQTEYRCLPVEYFKLENSKAYKDGPCVVLEQNYVYNKSRILQKIILTQGSSRMDFETTVDWHEKHKMLRSEFPVDILAEQATCDIQFGSIKRPTHKNTSWDEAKFEICAHKYVDISQNERGVALLNDCKYGYRVFDNIIDINLLRSPDFPGKDADQGRHTFVYSLYPHKGDHIEGGVIRASYELNMPLTVKSLPDKKQDLASSLSFLTVDNENIVIETVKKAQDSNDIIVRLYEATGSNCRTVLSSDMPVKDAWLVDGLENDLQKIDVQASGIVLDVKPWEIKNIKLNLTKV